MTYGLRDTRHAKLNISVESLATICWYVDASCGVHPDCKGHTGMMMTLGMGAAMSMSRVHKINLKSLTKLELVGMGCVASPKTWKRAKNESKS